MNPASSASNTLYYSLFLNEIIDYERVTGWMHLGKFLDAVHPAASNPRAPASHLPLGRHVAPSGEKAGADRGRAGKSKQSELESQCGAEQNKHHG
jgi:hypothetical protein